MHGMNTSNELLEETTALDILIYPDKRLGRAAKHVLNVDDGVREFADSMFATIGNRSGIGLAATQVGDDRRIIVIDCPELDVDKEQFQGKVDTHGRFTLINPMIVHREGRVHWRESCLSVPFTEAEVERDMIVHVSALDTAGKDIELRVGGLLSACIQHEIDHLNGKLFIDRLSRLRRDIATKKIKKKIKQIRRMWQNS